LDEGTGEALVNIVQDRSATMRDADTEFARRSRIGGATTMKGIQQLLVWRSDVVLTAVVAMTGALVLALPIAHVYRLVKHRHEYDPAVTETILLLPAVVAGIVIVVQGSLALSVSLVGVAGAVRFRSNLKDTNDAMFIFFAIALGIAAGVQGLDLAFAMCVVFYATVFAVSRIRLSASHRAHEGRSDSASPSDAPDRARSADDRQRLLDTESTDEPPESRERVIALRVVHVGAADGPRPAVEARLVDRGRAPVRRQRRVRGRQRGGHVMTARRPIPRYRPIPRCNGAASPCVEDCARALGGHSHA
jgi:uncharacterized membrane protein YhiD involved in acid resistance